MQYIGIDFNQRENGCYVVFDFKSVEESSLTFSLGTGVPVGVDILPCNG